MFESHASKVTMKACGNVELAESIINNTPESEKPSLIIIHLGVNNVDSMTPKELSERLFRLACLAANIHSCPVYISQVTPRGDISQQNVTETNKLLDSLVASGHGKGVSIITNSNISPGHLHDDRHLKRMRGPADLIPATLRLAKNFFMAVCNVVPTNTILHAAAKAYYPRRPIQQQVGAALTTAPHPAYGQRRAELHPRVITTMSSIPDQGYGQSTAMYQPTNCMTSIPLQGYGQYSDIQPYTQRYTNHPG